MVDANLQKIKERISEVAKVIPIWQKGLIHPGGPHYRLKGWPTPMSFGEDEALVFGKLLKKTRPNNVFIIGNAFGFSSTYIASIAKMHGGKAVVTLDAQTDNGKHCAMVAKKLTKKLQLEDILVNKKGTSPQDVEKSADGKKFDLVLIDGLHADPQVRLDFLACIPIANKDAVFVWHDYWIPGIPESVTLAKQMGYHCLFLPTSCEMVLGTKSPKVFSQLKKIFPEGSNNFPQHSKGFFYWEIIKIAADIILSNFRKPI